MGNQLKNAIAEIEKRGLSYRVDVIVKNNKVFYALWLIDLSQYY